MNGHGFFNLILVISFLLSNLGGITTNQPSNVTPGIAWNIKGNVETLLGRVDSWLGGLRTNTFKIKENTPVGNFPTATPTPGFGIAPTVDPTRTVEPTSSPTATETITPTVTPIGTPSVTPTIQPTVQITETAHVTLTLIAEPEPVNPGYPIKITWQIEGWVQDGADDELVMTLPQGFIPLSPEDNLPIWTADGQTIRIPSVSIKGHILFSVAEDVRGPFILRAELHSRNQVIAQTTLTLKEEGLTYIGPNGGAATGIGERVKVSFPPNAVPGITDDNPLAVRVRLPTSKANAPYYLGGMPFEIVAEQQARETGEILRLITEFSQTITITVNYSGTQFVGGDESALTVNYYDEGMVTWIPLTTYVDTQAKILTAYSDHFTLFDVNAQNWEAARLPSLKDFQVSQFTGAASYSFPIEVPPSPGGLQPSLSLSYSSQSVDSASGATQASWVGMGWSLETGYILRNQHGSMSWLEDDTYSLELNGQSSLLLKGTDGYYHTTGETFLRVQYDDVNDYWNVWDKSGTKYIFGDPDRASYPYFNDADPCHAAYRTWKWGLSKIHNIFGKELAYTYTKTTNQGTFVGGPCDGHTYYFDAAMYPLDIRYPNNYYRIYFDQVSTRLDYDSAWDQSTSRTLYQKNKLNSIRIQYNPDGDVGFNNLTDMRRYDLVYALGSDPFIFPGYTWTKGDKTLTLLQIKEYGWNGTGPLPTTRFTYGDGMHLTQATNGYGGTVSYSYEAWSEASGPESQTLRQMTNQPSAAPCATTQGEPGYLNTDGWGGSSCSYYNGNWYLLITGRSSKGIPSGLFHPGGVYQLHAELEYTDDSIQLGINDGHVDDLGLEHGNPGSITEMFSLPADATQTSSFLMKCSPLVGGAECYIHIFEATWLPTYYRVIQKTVTDDVTASSSTFTYTYDEPATNDAAHSIAVATTDPYYRYTEAYSEFRGHAMTREVDPVGKVTTNFFSQSDDRAGSAQIHITSSESFRDDFVGSTLDTGNWSVGSGANPQIVSYRGDNAVKLPGDSSFRKIYRQGSTIVSKKAILLQFQSDGISNELNLGIESGSGFGYLNLGVNVQADGSLHVCVISNCTTELISSANFHRDTWYVLLLILDDQGSYIRVWERDNPSIAGRYKQTMASGKLWHAYFETKNGNLWLDTFSEGQIYSLNMYLYDADSDAPIPADYNAKPKTFDNYTYNELTIYWSRLLQNISLDFEGDGSYIGKNTVYEYNLSEQGNTQYGNTTRIIEKYQDSGTAWVDYRLTLIKFYPNVDPQNGKYIVGLSGIKNLYPCPSGCANFTEESILSSEWYIYDSNTTYSQIPTVGKLSGTRTLINYVIGNQSTYADTIFGYNDWGNITTVTKYSGPTTTNMYGTGNGAQTSTTVYDTRHTFVTEERNALYPTFQATIYLYNLDINKALGLPSSITDANGAVTTATYDDYGRMLTIIRPLEEANKNTVTISYQNPSQPYSSNPFGTIVKQHISGSTDFIVRKYYNGIGQLIQTQVAGATIGASSKDILTDTFYDSAGRIYQQTVPYDITPGSNYHARSTSVARTTTTYDILGRTASIQATDGTFQASYSYSDGYINNVPYLSTTVTNGGNSVTTTRNDIWGRVANVAPPTGPDVSYSYNEADRMTSTVRGGATTTLTYDLAGRKKTMADPDMGTWVYVYDALGNLTRQKDAKGQRICLYYDGLNRLTGKHYRTDDVCPVSPTYQVTNTYDQGTNGIGRRTRQDYDLDRNGTMDSHTDWTYDSRGRMTQELRTLTGGTSFKTQWSYNSADLVSSMTYPSNASGGTSEVVNFTYLKQMRLDTVIGTNTYVYNTDYDAASRVTMRELGNASIIKNQYTYFDWTIANGQGRLQNIHTYKGTTDLQNLIYIYDANGNVQNIQDAMDKTGQNPQTQIFTYDALDRLTSAQAINGTNGTYALQNYTYDSSTGNMASRAGVNYTYADANHKHAVTAMSSGESYAYDTNGNQTQRVVGGHTYNLTYDTENRLVSVGGYVTAYFYYDGDGNRVKGTIGETTTTYIGNYFEWTGGTGTMKKYYYAGDTRVAMRTGSSTLNFLLGDHLGSMAITTDSLGANPAEIRYMPWGTTRYTSGTTPTTYRFTGQRIEGNLGLYFYGARWFDPSTGRFIQPDNIIPNAMNSQAFDRYAYVFNNPLKYTDPGGNTTWPSDVDLNQTCGPDNYKCGGLVDPIVISQNEDQPFPDTKPDSLVGLTWTGQRMNALYQRLYKMSGNQFTLEDFLTLILQRELASWWNHEAYGFFKEAAVRWFYTNWGSLSMNAIFNWLGSGMQSAGGLRNAFGNDVGVYAQVFNQGLSIAIILADQCYAAVRARIIAQTIMNPPTTWTTYDSTAPYTWGSISLIMDPIKKTHFQALPDGSTDPTGILFKSGDEFVLTLDQSEYWYGSDK